MVVLRENDEGFPEKKSKILQVQVVDQATHPPKCHSFAGLDRQIGSSPPAILEGEKKEIRKKEEVLHLFRCYTHTHTRPEPGQPWKARGRKKPDTDDGQKAKTAQGGKGNEWTCRTNLRGETDLTETEHTSKPHDTLRTGTGGEN